MKKLLLKAALMLLSCLGIYSFANAPGGEGYEVYLNGKVILQRFGQDMNKPHTIRFTAGTEQEQISVRYYHCGQPGKKRALLVKDNQDNLLREFHFDDESKAGTGMQCRVGELIQLRKNEADVLKLYYRSSEIPGGRLLVSFISDKGIAAARP